MAGDKTYITNNENKLHRATRVKSVTPSSIVWSSNPNDYTVQVLVDGKWHRAILTYDVQNASFFDDINIDKALVVGDDGKSHTALIVDPVSASVNMSPIPTDDHSTLAGTTTGETALNVYSEEWASVQWQDNVNVYKVLVQGSDGKMHTALLTTSAAGEIEVIVKGTSSLELLDAIADSLVYLKAFGGTELRNVPEGYAELEYIQGTSNVQYINTGIVPNSNMKIYLKCGVTSITSGASYSPFGSRQTGGASDGVGIFVGSGANTRIDSFYFLASASDRWQVDNVASVGDIYETTFYNGTQTLTKNGTSLGSHSYIPVNTTTQPMYVNALNNAGALQSGQWGSRIYRFTVEGICDLVPAKRLSDNAIGMWDKIRKQFFTNAGTGAFTAGAEVTAPSPTLPRDIWCNNGAVKAIRPIEYLESTGTQYIDTGFKPNQDTKTELVAQFLNVSLYSMLFGTRKAPLEDIYTIQKTSTGYWALGYNTTATPVGTPDTNKHIFLKDKNKQYIDGSLIADYTYANFQCPYTAGIFGANISGTETAGSPIRVYSCKIWDNDTLVRDFIPALDTNNVPCMFDKVEGKCYYNQGTGQFIAPYLPAEYERLEYIQGNNNEQYINTGIVPTSSMNMYFKGQFVSVDASTPTQVSFLAGARDVGGQYGIFLQLAPTSVGLDWFVVNGRWSESHTRAVGDVVEMKVSNSLAQIWINGTSVGTHQYTPNDTTQYPLFLNGLNTVGQPFSNVSSINRVYRFTIAGTCDMIPARRISDGEIGMYDVIRRQFFTNAGTGSFIAGEYSVLPDGYTQYDYIESTGTQYIDTGFKPNQNSGFIIDYYANATQQPRVFMIAQEIDSSSYGYGIVLNRGANIAVYNGKRLQDNYWQCNDFSGTGRYIVNVNKTAAVIKDSTGTRVTHTFPTDTFQLEYNLYLFTLNNAGTITTTPATVRVYSFKIYDNGTLVRNFIPAKRNSDNVVGMYDTVNNVFYTNAGTGVFGTGSVVPPYTPEQLQIAVDGTVEKVGIHSANNKNLFNGVFEQGSLSSGVTAYTNLRIRTPNYLTFPAGTYTVSCASDYQIWVEVNNAGGSWVSTKTITLSATDKVKIGVRNKTNPSTTPISVDEPVNVQIEAGSTATAYEPYYDGGLTICENLFAIGTYIDEQELLAGDVVRNVGIKVLNGTEDWTYDSTFTRFILKMTERMPTAPLRTIPLYSTHFPNVHNGEAYVNVPNNTILYASSVQIQIKTTDWNSLGSFQSWLASQYNAGTPVIIVYPLETPTTESVAGQTLNVVEGDNYAEIMQASIDGLELEAKYKKSA